MLGRTARGLFWAFRYLERSDNVARLLDAGVNIAAGTTTDPASVWRSVLASAGVPDGVISHQNPKAGDVMEYLLCDTDNPSSVRSMVTQARSNGRMVRTALSRETWEAMNQCWIVLDKLLAETIDQRDIQDVLGEVRRQSALVHGALHSSSLRNDNFSFCRLGTYLERTEYTARILDVKYFVLLPSAFHVGSVLDNVQWETILRSVSAHQSYLWLHRGELTAGQIARYLILDDRMPRSIIFAAKKVASNLAYLENIYGQRHRSHVMIESIVEDLGGAQIDVIIGEGLHEFIVSLSARNAELSAQVERDYQFYE